MFQVLGQNLVNMEQKEQAKELMIPLGNTSTSTWYSHLITIITITIREGVKRIVFRDISKT